MKKYKDIKKELRMGDAEIAADFGYKTRESFTKSSAKPRIETGLEKVLRPDNQKSKRKFQKH